MKKIIASLVAGLIIFGLAFASYWGGHDGDFWDRIVKEFSVWIENLQ